MCTLENNNSAAIARKTRKRVPLEWLGGLPARLSVALAAGLVVALAGCVVGPKYVRPSVQTPVAYKEGASAGSNDETWKAAQPQDAAIRGKWWETFNDAELNSLEEESAIADQNIVAAADNLLAARALVRESRSQYFPTVATNPSINNSRPSPAQFGGLQTGASSSNLTVKSYTAYSLPFDASWEPDLWERVRNGVKANVFAAQASAADFENVRLSEQAELAADYYELRAQDSLKEVFDSTVAAYQDTFDMTQNLYRAGLATDEALAQAEAQLKGAQAEDTNLGILRAQYEHAIAVLTGQPASTFSLPVRPLQTQPPAIPLGVPSELLERRPDIARAERGVAQANAQIGIAKAAYFPNVLLSATAGFGNSSATSWLTWPSRFWSIGPSLAETIVDAGLRRATMQQYRATYDETVANYRETVLVAFQQVEDNLASLRILSQDIQEQDSAVDAATRSLQEATARYRAGLDPYLNVISAQTILLNDQQTAVNFRMQQMVAAVQLIKALGGGWNVSEIPSSKKIQAKAANGASR
jgi:NodT family efflux transporter outer membrane factor (OMF) lipoprotein